MKAALAALLGGGVATMAVGDVSAAGGQCRHGRQTCTRDSQCCSDSCPRSRGIPLKDRNRCTCEDGTTQCGNRCVDTDTDKRNCGACGVVCHAGMPCVDGVCTCVPTCDGSNCGGDDGCGGACPPYVSLDDDGACVDADGYCASPFWRTGGDRADCLVSPQGDVMFVCSRVAPYDYKWGGNCDSSADCQAWCDLTDNNGCICVTRQHYGDYTSGIEDYSSDGNYCVRQIGTFFGLDEAVAGGCGSW